MTVLWTRCYTNTPALEAKPTMPFSTKRITPPAAVPLESFHHPSSMDCPNRYYQHQSILFLSGSLSQTVPMNLNQLDQILHFKEECPIDLHKLYYSM